jgi:hypothetical protein
MSISKIAISTLIVIQVIVVYIIVAIDRFVMAIFIGVELPSMSKKEIIIDENTTDEQIEKSVIDEENYRIAYKKDYIPKARRRALRALTLLLTIYLFTILSWTVILLSVSVFAISVGIVILWKYVKRKTKKVEDETVQN